jgi:hypothetical protein
MSVTKGSKLLPSKSTHERNQAGIQERPATGEAGAAAAAGRQAGQAGRQEVRRGEDRRGAGTEKKLHKTELETLMVVSCCTWQAKQKSKEEKKRASVEMIRVLFLVSG